MQISETFRMLLKIGRTVFLIDAGIFFVSGLVCLLAGWLTWLQYGDLLTKVGLGIIAVALLIGVGGNFSRVEDLTAYSLSGAMRMETFLLQTKKDSESRFRFIIATFSAAANAILTGYWLLTR